MSPLSNFSKVFLLCACIVMISTMESKIKDLKHSIEIVDNDPEFLVGVKGIDNPLCFHIDGSQNQVVRLLQDPLSGVIVNARVIYDDLTNKTYLGAILISQGNFRVIAKQRLILLMNDSKLDWSTSPSTHVSHGHRVFVGNDTLAVTFRKKNITLIVRRHVIKPTQDVVSEDVDRTIPLPGTGRDQERHDERTLAVHVRTSIPHARGDIMPAMDLRGRGSIHNRGISSKRRRGLLLQNLYGINQDTAFVRDVVVEVDGQGHTRKSVESHRNLGHDEKIGSLEDRSFSRHRGQDEGNQYSPPSAVLRRILSKDVRNLPRFWRSDNRLQGNPPLISSARQQRDTEEDYTLDEDNDKKRDQTIFLGLYISDATDLSNQTHGLLGQFLFKNGSLLKLQKRKDKTIALLQVSGNPTRLMPAMSTTKYNSALNTSYTCLKIREQGREVIDGDYFDYLVPNIRYVSLKELPPI